MVEEEKVVQEVDEDSKTSENGDTKETKENGSSEEKESDEKEAESTENGDSTGKCCHTRRTNRFCLLFVLLVYLKSEIKRNTTIGNKDIPVYDYRCPRRQLLRKEEIYDCG